MTFRIFRISGFIFSYTVIDSHIQRLENDVSRNLDSTLNSQGPFVKTDHVFNSYWNDKGLRNLKRASLKLALLQHSPLTFNSHPEN